MPYNSEIQLNSCIHDDVNTILAEALYFEARGEPIQGQLAVGEVVLNRVEDPRYPNSICKVYRPQSKVLNSRSVVKT